MLEFFRRAFRRNEEWKDGPIFEPPEAPDIPSIVISKNKHGKWVYEQPPNPDYDPETHTLTLKARRALDRRFESFIAIRNPRMLVCPVDFDTMSHELLEQSLVEAREYAQRVPKEGYVYVSDLIRLTFYVHFKQATEGDITNYEIQNQPSLFRDWEGYWKVYGWKMARGTPREEARDRYVKLFYESVNTRADFAWAPPGYDEYLLKGEAEPEADRIAREASEVGKSAAELAAEKRELEDLKWIAFFEAVRIIRNFPRKPYSMPEPMRAMYYALYKQATVGDLRAFQTTDECQKNSHYAWCRQRPADAPVNAKKEKEKKAKLEKERKEREKQEERNRKSRKAAGRAEYEWSHNVNGRAVPLSQPTSAVYDPEQEIDDPRTFDQLRYDFWMEQQGTEHYAAVRKYLNYFYQTGARHGYVWDPPGCEDHMSEAGNQYTTKAKKERLKEMGLDNFDDGDDTNAGPGDGVPSQPRRFGVKKVNATAEADAQFLTVMNTEMQGTDGLAAKLTPEQQREVTANLLKAKEVDEEATRLRVEREEKERLRRKREQEQLKAKKEKEKESTSTSGSPSGKKEGKAAHVDPAASSSGGATTDTPSDTASLNNGTRGNSLHAVPSHTGSAAKADKESSKRKKTKAVNQKAG